MLCQRRQLKKVRRLRIDPGNLLDFGGSRDWTIHLDTVQSGLHTTARLVCRRRQERANKCRAPGPDRASQFFLQLPL